jgi:hypothetical protein
MNQKLKGEFKMCCVVGNVASKHLLLEYVGYTEN